MQQNPSTPLPQKNITMQPIYAVGPESQTMKCPTCQAIISTKVEFTASTKTHLFGLCLCCCLCWPCAWIPYVMDSCQNANHFCPNCKTFIGVYQN